MLYITGDTHGDFHRLTTRAFPAQKEMTKADTVLICGDFGGLWDDSPRCRHLLDELERRPFTTAFVDGEGNIVSELIVGGRSYEDWKEIIDSLMA